ncbi:hypothetical protein YC2023_062275 [Brassica napus]
MDYAQFYASEEGSRRRHRDKTTETEPKTAASDTVKPVEYRSMKAENKTSKEF